MIQRTRLVDLDAISYTVRVELKQNGDPLKVINSGSPAVARNQRFIR